MSHISIRAASPAHKSKTKNKTPPKKLWMKASHSVQDISHWKNSESTTRAFTAKASFRILLPDDKIKSRGECININQNNTVAKKICGEKISDFLLKNIHKNWRYLHNILNSVACITGLLILFGIIPDEWSYPLGIIWMTLPIQILLVANTDVMWRIWRKSMSPYLQVYVSLLETWAFCDLCNWDKRIMIAAPPMLLNQVMIINSDAVYFHPKDKQMILSQVYIAILWKLVMLFCLRFSYFPNMHPRKMITLMMPADYTTYNTTSNYTETQNQEFFLNNISVYAGKTSSMIVLLMGQIIFRYRHPEQAYALRTHYTVKSNREWNELNRNNRIQKKDSLKYHVEETREFLEEEVV